MQRPERGIKFGHLTTTGEGYAKNSFRYEKCICDCGKEKYVMYFNLKKGYPSSCGCSKPVSRNKKFIDKGTKFGHRITLGENKKSEKGKYYELCQCDCGKVQWIFRDNLCSGKTKSCGCHSKDNIVGCSFPKKQTHGKTRSRIYHIFDCMKQRCNNPKNSNYSNYGGRGIKIEWLTFKDFYKDMGESYHKHCEEYGEKDTTIDRIDVNGNYCKENCKRSSWDEQHNNMRYSHYITYKGETLTIAKMAQKYGINHRLIRDRLMRGYSVEQAIETPLQIKGYKHIKKGGKDIVGLGKTI